MGPGDFLLNGKEVRHDEGDSRVTQGQSSGNMRWGKKEKKKRSTLSSAKKDLFYNN